MLITLEDKDYYLVSMDKTTLKDFIDCYREPWRNDVYNYMKHMNILIRHIYHIDSENNTVEITEDDLTPENLDYLHVFYVKNIQEINKLSAK